MKKTLRIRVLLGLGVSIVGCILINGCITPKPIDATPVTTGMINLDTSSGYTPRIGDWYRFEVRWTTTRFEALPEGWETLDSIVAFLRFHSGVICEIGVHTDFRGNSESNDSLTYKRAKFLVNYIERKGIDPTRIIPIG